MSKKLFSSCSRIDRILHALFVQKIMCEIWYSQACTIRFIFASGFQDQSRNLSPVFTCYSRWHIYEGEWVIVSLWEGSLRNLSDKVSFVFLVLVENTQTQWTQNIHHQRFKDVATRENVVRDLLTNRKPEPIVLDGQDWFFATSFSLRQHQWVIKVTSGWGIIAEEKETEEIIADGTSKVVKKVFAD